MMHIQITREMMMDVLMMLMMRRSTLVRTPRIVRGPMVAKIVGRNVTGTR